MHALNTPVAGIATGRPIDLPRWSSETPLFVLIVLASLAIWGLMLISIFGILYAGMIALVLFFSHVIFIAHIRGSGVRLGPDQFPELWERVVTLSRQAGLPNPPEAYVVQAGGSLNAFATKLFRGRIVVLFAELLDACGDDTAARDMVVGHEIAHHRLGHLDWFWLTAPGRFIPFLGSAYSRACEFSCDRWGTALCGDRNGAMRGLAILAAGGVRGPNVNLQAFVAQRQSLDTGWMSIGCWLSNYPPLSARIEALDPLLGRTIPYSTRGPLRAAFILSAFVVLPAVISIGAVSLWVALVGSNLQQLSAAADTPSYDALAEDEDSFEEYAEETVEPLTEEEIATFTTTANTDLAAIAEVIRAHHGNTGVTLEDAEALSDVWPIYHNGGELPSDPFDGLYYGIRVTDAGAQIFSSGPDRESDSEDDIVVDVVL